MRDFVKGKPSQMIKRTTVAAYLLDRADQYGDDDPCWIALADAARSVMVGEVEHAERAVGLDENLHERLAHMTERQAQHGAAATGGDPRRREIMQRKLVDTMIELFKREACAVLAEVAQPCGFEEFCRRLDRAVERKGRKP